MTTCASGLSFLVTPQPLRFITQLGRPRTTQPFRVCETAVQDVPNPQRSKSVLSSGSILQERDHLCWTPCSKANPGPGNPRQSLCLQQGPIQVNRSQNVEGLVLKPSTDHGKTQSSLEREMSINCYYTHCSHTRQA